MLRVIVKRAPNVYAAEQYRIGVSESAGERGVDLVVRGDADKVREFLLEKLELDSARVSSVLSQLAANRVAATELDWDMAEVRTLSRTLDREAKAADDKSGSGAGVSQGAAAHVQ